MLKSVLGVKRQSRDQWDVTLCLVLVVKLSVICVLSLGSLITKITSSAIFSRKDLTRWSIDRKR